MVGRFLVPVVVVATIASCGGGEGGPGTEASPAAMQAASTAPEAAEYESVRFRASDGRELVGRLWGDGDVGVVLAHGFSRGIAQDGWVSFAAFLADRGYRVLTFNFRGFCDSEECSGGAEDPQKYWHDVAAATAFMEEQGAAQVVLVGASMGGLAVLRAARMPGIEVAGVVSLSTPQFPFRYYAGVGETEAADLTRARLRQIDEPKLFVAGTDDVQSKYEITFAPGIERVRFAVDAKRMFTAAREPKELALVKSSAHSSELVTQAEDHIVEETRALLLQFIEKVTR